MAEGNRADTMELFRRWQDAALGAWTIMSGVGRNYMDPLGVYRQASDGSGDTGDSSHEKAADSGKLWRQWMEETGEVWRRASGLSGVAVGLTPHWIEATEAFWNEMLDGGNLPTDPLDYYLRWYNATSGPFSKMAREVSESEEVLEESRRYVEAYALLEGAFQRASEKYFGDLRLSTRSDSVRVASLVVGLDDKVDSMEEAFEDHADATGASLASIEERMDDIERKLDDRTSALERVEEKLDRLLAGLGTQSGAGTEPEATDAARRKARDIGIGLEGIEGSGTGGRITVEDVRREGGDLND